MDDLLKQMQSDLSELQSKISTGEWEKDSLWMCVRGKPGRIISVGDHQKYLEQEIARLKKEQSLQQPEKF